MKKRIIAWAVLLSVCAAALGLWCSAAAGKAARTLPCEEEGLILSITPFDGKSDSKPFLKCFGHTWIGLDNRTGHTVYLKDRAIPDGEMVTFSVWAVSGLSGLLFDLEPCYIANYGRYIGRLSLSTNIGEEQLKVIEDYMGQHDKWTVDRDLHSFPTRRFPICGQKLQLLVDPSVERGGGRGCSPKDTGLCLHARKN